MTPTKHYLAMLRQEAELAMTNKAGVTLKGEYLLELLDLIEGYEEEVADLLKELEGGSDDE